MSPTEDLLDRLARNLARRLTRLLVEKEHLHPPPDHVEDWYWEDDLDDRYSHRQHDDELRQPYPPSEWPEEAVEPPRLPD